MASATDCWGLSPCRHGRHPSHLGVTVQHVLIVRGDLVESLPRGACVGLLGRATRRRCLWHRLSGGAYPLLAITVSVAGSELATRRLLQIGSSLTLGHLREVLQTPVGWRFTSAFLHEIGRAHV